MGLCILIQITSKRAQLRKKFEYNMRASIQLRELKYNRGVGVRIPNTHALETAQHRRKLKYKMVVGLQMHSPHKEWPWPNYRREWICQYPTQVQLGAKVVEIQVRVGV